jgi:hypothetical protein
MKRGFTLHFERFSYFLISLLSVMLMLASTGAGAAIYDDFDGPSIDTAKWTITGTGFSQSADDGYLHFWATASPAQTMVSTSLYTSGVFTMPFSDYICDNAGLPAQGLGSVAGFGLGTRSSNDWVRFERGQVQGDPAHGITGGYVEVNWVSPNEAGHPIHVNWIQSDITSGSLQTVYNGTDIAFFYRSNASDPWTQMMKTGPNGQPILLNGQEQPLVLTADWGMAVPMFIQALTGGNLGVTPPDQYSLSFKVDYVDVSPVPEPSILPLLAGALAIVLGTVFRQSILRQT